MELIDKILKLFAEYDIRDFLYWDENLNFFILCNDIFDLATVDGVEISSLDDINLLKKLLDEYEYDLAILLFLTKKKNRIPNDFYLSKIPYEYIKLIENFQLNC